MEQAAILECIAEDPAGLFYLSIPFIELILAPNEFEEANELDVFDDEDDGTTVGYDSWNANEESHSLSIDDPRSLMALIQELAPDVIAHRLVLDPQAKFSGLTARQIVDEVLTAVDVPV